MRLYLSIERNALAPVKTVWPLSDLQQKWTIAQLLEAIDKTFPLETQHWGLEDYVVTLNGYECVHHHEIASICKDNDALVIRPLQTIEVRARTMSGRHQISNDGRRLFDGIAFGRPALKPPVRPDIHIPPRKRRKLDIEEVASDDVLMIEAEPHQEPEDSTSESEDSDFEDNLEEDDSELEESISEDNLNEDDSDSSDSDTSSSASSSSEDSDSDSDASWDGLNVSSEKKQDHEGEQHDSAHQHPVSDSHVEAAAEQDRSDENTLAIPDTTAATQAPNGIPNNGRGTTKNRNIRRRKKARLAHLQEEGRLPSTATFADLEAYDALGPIDVDEAHVAPIKTQNKDQPSQTSAHAILMARKQKLLDALATGGIDIDGNYEADANKMNTAAEEDEPPQQLSSKVRPLELLDGYHTSPIIDYDGDTPAAEPSTLMVPRPIATRRAKLDLAGSTRLVFGSLGVRVPRTEADKTSTRAKLAARASNGTNKLMQNGTVESVSADPPECADIAASEYEDWQSKINLSAVECWDEQVNLSTPPFPYTNGWDPQYQKRKKRKRNDTQSGPYANSYNQHNGIENIVLNYDDVDEDADAEFDDNHWEEGALLDGYGEADQADEGDQALEDDFPAVPGDITTLSLLEEESAAVGDFVIYQALECSPATKWQPTFLSHTIQLLEKTTDGWKVKRALRDLPKRQYDEEGNRVYDKFETREESDGEEDEVTDVTEMPWKDITDARLLLRP